jgi:hypothetical protein
MNSRWNLAVWRQDPWRSERSFNMFNSSIHECRSSATHSFWHNLQESLPNVLNSWRDHPAKECCKIAHHVACQHWGLNHCFAATSVPNEWQEYYCEFHFSGTGGHSADGPLPAFSSLRRCTNNVILASARNSDLIDNQCLAANISITAPPAWAITRAVTIVFWFNILHEIPVQVPLKHLAKIVETVVRHCDSKLK